MVRLALPRNGQNYRRQCRLRQSHSRHGYVRDLGIFETGLTLLPAGFRTNAATTDFSSILPEDLEAVLRLEFPYGQLGRETGVRLGVRDATGAFEVAGTSEVRLTWSYADHAANDGQAREVEVDRAGARQDAARARQDLHTPIARVRVILISC